MALVVVKNPPANAGDVWDGGSISESGRSPGKGHGNLLWYSCLENPMVRGAWQAAVHRVAKIHDWRDSMPHARTHDILLTVYTIQIYIHRAVSHGFSWPLTRLRGKMIAKTFMAFWFHLFDLVWIECKICNLCIHSKLWYSYEYFGIGITAKCLESLLPWWFKKNLNEAWNF